MSDHETTPGLDPQHDAFALLEAAGLFFGEDSEVPNHTLNLNDVWCWACSGGEVVTEEEAPELSRLFQAYGWAGVLYWASEKGGIRSEFEDNNRFIDFVRNEERIRKEIPESSKRAYHKVAYTLGALLEPSAPEPRVRASESNDESGFTDGGFRCPRCKKQSAYLTCAWGCFDKEQSSWCDAPL